MINIKDISLKAKLIFCTGFLSILAISVGIIGLQSVNIVAREGGEIYDEALLPCLYLAQMTKNMTNIHSDYLNIAYGGEVADLNKIQEGISDNESLIEAYAKYSTASSKDEELYNQLKESYAIYHEAVYNHVKAITAQTVVDNQSTIQDVVAYAMDTETVLNSLMELKQTGAYEKAANNQSKANMIQNSLVSTMVIGILFSLIIVYVIIRGITRQLGHFMKVVDQVAEGELDVKMNLDANTEVGKVAQNFDKMIDNLREVIMNIEASSEQVHMGARQVAHTSSMLAQGATEQATTIEELTAAVEEIDAQIKQNADHAEKMNNIAVYTKGVVEKSHVEMQQMLNAMADINYSSSEVAKIIKVIDDIAFQTNILALNAAVEAARAGQHGKGFTVVAEEVRNLAAKSAEAAKETTSMIESSIRNTQIGMEIANGAADELGRVVAGINEVVELTSEISTSCAEQTIGISQISEGAVQISNVIQNNSATSEESAAASEELAGQAELMREEVARFRTNKRYIASKGYDMPREIQAYGEGYGQAFGDSDFGKY